MYIFRQREEVAKILLWTGMICAALCNKFNVYHVSQNRI